jgi:hypothetical protein
MLPNLADDHGKEPPGAVEAAAAAVFIILHVYVRSASAFSAERQSPGGTHRQDFAFPK